MGVLGSSNTSVLACSILWSLCCLALHVIFLTTTSEPQTARIWQGLPYLSQQGEASSPRNQADSIVVQCMLVPYNYEDGATPALVP
jgi:hypothetical protein